MTPNGNPQLKDGFARIANETLAALSRTTLSDYENRCIHFLFMKTYGMPDKKTGESKKKDAISYGQWSLGTAIDRRNVSRTLNRLANRRIIKVEAFIRPGHNQVLIWEFNKHYLEWVGYEAKVSSVETTVESQLSLVETTLPVQPSSVETPLSFEVSSLETKSVVSTDDHSIYTLDSSSRGKKTAKKFETFKEYAEKLKIKYPVLAADWDHQITKFWAYWDGHDVKHTLKNEKLALINWMDKETVRLKNLPAAAEQKSGEIYGLHIVEL